MTIQGPSDPDSVWLKFLTDDEEAIRKSAPREPSARDRALWHSSAMREADTVGDVWRPDDDRPGPSWRHLDSRERARGLLRVLVGMAALVALLGIFSWIPNAPPGPSEEQRIPAARESENVSGDTSAAEGPLSSSTPPQASSD
ncbi:hypothetical protein [Streptomyces soliscabiei]|uniref:hypothetical protein n=1 Tax=Streptomyces soliscabiei TaxID=588897 RepID=UPI00299FDADC|nr:hypothetical protein [Streptomyces sp. NY05-11A]MDX2681681.1 hypothetical protein [Streptomyces sp. NY05-11A]